MQITRKAVFVALFAALTALTGFIAIPVAGSPVPIVLENMFTVLSGLLLGPVLGTLSTVLLVLAGAVGLPVFSGGGGGMAKLMGPTGGFIFGYILASLVAGLIASSPKTGKKDSLVRIIIAALLGFVVMYIPGILHFMNSLDKTLEQTMAMCVIPYIPGDIIKAVLCVIITPKLRKTSATYVFAENR